jgi:hypothetical protein
MKAQLAARHEGLGNQARTMILEEGLKWSKEQMTSVEADTVNARRLQIEQIATAFDVPLHRLGIIPEGGGTAILQAHQMYLNNTLSSDAERWENKLNDMFGFEGWKTGKSASSSTSTTSTGPTSRRALPPSGPASSAASSRSTRRGAGRACRTSTAETCFSSPRTWCRSIPLRSRPNGRTWQRHYRRPGTRRRRRSCSRPARLGEQRNAQAEHSLGRAVPRSRQGRDCGRCSAPQGVRRRSQGAGDAERSLDFVISTDTVDRMGDTIDVEGWDLGNYRKNPVVLWAHDSSLMPVAKASNIRVEDGKLKARAEFMPADMSTFADSVFRALKGGFLSAVSVGFAPVKYAFSDEPGRSFGIDF